MQKWPEGYIQQGAKFCEEEDRLVLTAPNEIEWELHIKAVLAKRDEFRTIWNLTNINEFVEDIK